MLEFNNNNIFMQEGEPVIIKSGKYHGEKGVYLDYNPFANIIRVQLVSNGVIIDIGSEFVEPVYKERLYMVYNLDDLNQMIYKRFIVAKSNVDAKAECKDGEEYLLLDKINIFDIILQRKK